MFEIIAFIYLISTTTGGWRIALIIGFIIDLFLTMIRVGSDNEK